MRCLSFILYPHLSRFVPFFQVLNADSEKWQRSILHIRLFIIKKSTQHHILNTPAMFKTMVGTTRFELAASSTPRKRSTKLSYVPNSGYYTDLFASCQGIADKNDVHPIRTDSCRLNPFASSASSGGVHRSRHRSHAQPVRWCARRAGGRVPC